jgi:hypothetical protein
MEAVGGSILVLTREAAGCDRQDLYLRKLCREERGGRERAIEVRGHKYQDPIKALH